MDELIVVLVSSALMATALKTKAQRTKRVSLLLAGLAAALLVSIRIFEKGWCYLYNAIFPLFALVTVLVVAYFALSALEKKQEEKANDKTKINEKQ